MATSEPTLEALAFLYLTFGHATDDAMTGDEMRALADKIRDWSPDTPLETVGEILKRTVTTYKSLGTKDKRFDHARQGTAKLKDEIEADQLRTILQDLETIAVADGTVSEEEKAFIVETAKTLGIESAES